jgi:hypothetical protein
MFKLNLHPQSSVQFRWEQKAQVPLAVEIPKGLNIK